MGIGDIMVEKRSRREDIEGFWVYFLVFGFFIIGYMVISWGLIGMIRFVLCKDYRGYGKVGSG